jgi:hypothetical protein
MSRLGAADGIVLEKACAKFLRKALYEKTAASIRASRQLDGVGRDGLRETGD